MDKQHALVERFFQFLVRPQGRKWRLADATYFYKNLEKTMMMASLLLGLIFISSLCLILYSYQKNKEDIQKIQNIATQTIIEKGNFAQEIVSLRGLIQSKSKLWYRFIYGLEITDKKLLASLDEIILRNIKKDCIPYVMSFVTKQLSHHLAKEEWGQLLKDFHVYLMLTNKEQFHKTTVVEWFEQHKDVLGNILPILKDKVPQFLQSITHSMFENVQEDTYLYDRIICALQSSAFSQSLYSSIAQQFLDKPFTSIAKFASNSKKLLSLMDPAIDSVKIPYIYTREGYSSFESHKKSISATLKKMEHLKEVLAIDLVKAAVEETTQIYKEAYEVEWNNMWTKIRFKNAKDIPGCLANFKTLSEELLLVRNFINQIEQKILIQNVTDYLSNNNYVLKNDTVAKGIAKGVAKLNEFGVPTQDRFISYTPMDLEAFNLAKDAIQANLAELIQCSAELSNCKNKDYACYQMVLNIPKEELVTHKGLVLASTLSSPFSSMYKELVSNFDWIIHKGSASHINSVWYRDVYSYYLKHIHNKYPFNPYNYQDQVAIEDFVSFFGAEGKFSQFQKNYLEKGRLAISTQTKKMLHHFEQIQLHWFGENSQPRVAFNITNVTIEPTVKHVDLQLLGKQVRISSNNLGPNEFVWTNKGLAMAKIEFLNNQNLSSSTVYAGPWSWYKLLELEDAKGPDSIRRTLKSCSGGIGFLVHFEPKFFPLGNSSMQIPKYIAGVTNHLAN